MPLLPWFLISTLALTRLTYSSPSNPLCGSDPIFGPNDIGTPHQARGEVAFPKDWSVYQIKTPYTCVWSFFPSSPSQRIAIRFTKFRTDQRCFMKERSLKSLNSTYTCHVHASYKYPLEAINRIIVSETGLNLNDTASENNPTQLEEFRDASTPYSSGCICGTGESRSNSVQRGDFDDNWWFVSGPPSLKTGALRVEFLVPRPHIGLAFKMEYEFIDDLADCGNPIAESQNMEGVINFGGFYTNSTSMGIVCDWNIALPPKIEMYGGKLQDWQLLLKFTSIDTPSTDLADKYITVGTDPGKWALREKIQDELLLYNSFNTSTLDLNGNAISILPLIIPKTPTNLNGTDNWLYPLLESKGSRILLRFIYRPNGVHDQNKRSFKMRWSPFLKLDKSLGQEEACDSQAFTCSDQLRSPLTSRGPNSNAIATANYTIALPKSSRVSYCLPPFLLCNGHPECPNSSDDEEPAMCQKLAESNTSPVHKLGPWPPYVAIVGLGTHSAAETESRLGQSNESSPSTNNGLNAIDKQSSSGGTNESAVDRTKSRNKTLLILLCIFLPLFLLAILTVCVIVLRRVTGRKSGYNVKYYNTTNYKLHREMEGSDRVKSNGKSHGMALDKMRRDLGTANGGASNGNGAGHKGVVDKLTISDHGNVVNGVKHESYMPLVSHEPRKENGHTAI